MNAPNPDGGRKRSRKRGSGRGNKSDPAGGNKKRNRSKPPKIDIGQFWGDPSTLPSVEDRVTSTPDVTAVVTSLGRPPVPGHETPAEHWFSLVYERAAVLAGALAAAGGIDHNAEEPGGEAPVP